MFATAPLRMAATAGREPAYTVGSQKWNGNRPSLTLNAMKKPVATRIAALGSTTRIRSATSRMASVPVTW